MDVSFQHIEQEFNQEIIRQIYELTLDGAPHLVFELLCSLRCAIDQNNFVSLEELPVVKRRKRMIFECLDHFLSKCQYFDYSLIESAD
jgi:hypothetical protein